MPKIDLNFRRFVFQTIVMTLWICLSQFGHADFSTANLSVTVTDSSGAVIAGARLMLRNADTNQEQQTDTGKEGAATFSFLKPGRYALTVSKDSFADVVIDHIVLNVGDNRRLQLSLKVKGTTQTVVVDGSGLALNTTDASVSTVVDRKFVESMPLNGRSLQSLISLAPGVVRTPIPYGSSAGNSGEFSINGQRTEANYYTVDGVSANVGVGNQGTYSAGAAGLTPAETAVGTTQNLASIDALQEFRINTSTYSAEYGRTPGGQISLETRSGTDHLNGTLFDYFRNDALDANNWFNDHTEPVTLKTAERQNDFGGTVGGPIFLPHLYDGHHRTFFFYSYEGLRLTLPAPATTTEVPDASLRNATASALQPFVDAFPLANGSAVSGASGLSYFTGAYSLPSRLDTHSIRLDHARGSKMNLFGRYSDSGSSVESRSTSNLAQLTSIQFTTRSATSGLTYLFNNNTSNDARFNYSWTANTSQAQIDSYGGATPATLATYLPGVSTPYSQFAAFIFLGNHPSVDLYRTGLGQTQTNIVDTLQIALKRHFLKVGVDYRRLETTQGTNQFASSITYSTQQQLQNNTTGTAYVYSNGAVPAEPIYWNFSAFVQDDWKLDTRTTVSLGLRWDLNPPPTNGNGRIPPVLDQITNLATTGIAPEGTPEWNTDYQGLAPRLAIASQLRDRAGWETVLRGGIGAFYDTGNTLGSIGFTGLGFGVNKNYSGLSFPFASSVYMLPTASTASPYNATAVGYDRDLRLPYSLQWNISMEQALGASRSFTLGYVASAGRRLTVGLFQNPKAINPAFSAGNGVYVIKNGAWSNYNSLQAQFKQRLNHGIQVLASMTWSHSIDNLSTNFINYQPLLKGDSDFDIRQNFQLAITYDMPSLTANRILHPVLTDWSFDLRAFSRTSAPVDIYGSAYLASDGTQQYARPNVLPQVPLYLYGSRSAIPGGKKINFAAFQPVTGSVGNAPRNFLRSFGANEIDFAMRREFPLNDKVNLQFRAEAFNILNHPNFGALYNTMNSGAALFGTARNTLNVALKNQSALYEQGGPRSLQLALKLQF